jgi:hypothetical protein
MMMYVKRFPDVLKTYNFCRSREKLSSREVWRPAPRVLMAHFRVMTMLMYSTCNENTD